MISDAEGDLPTASASGTVHRRWLRVDPGAPLVESGKFMR